MKYRIIFDTFRIDYRKSMSFWSHIYRRHYTINPLDLPQLKMIINYLLRRRLPHMIRSGLSREKFYKNHFPVIDFYILITKLNY